MPTAIAAASPRTRAISFALRGVAWSLGLFGLMRVEWLEAHAILPLTHAQALLAGRVFHTAAAPIQVTLACSGVDAIALCAAAILAYPAAWRVRLAGAAGGLALILALNTARIGTLGLAAGSPSWFTALHVYAWPAVLTLAIAGFVFGWMRLVERGPIPHDSRVLEPARPARARANRVDVRFAVLPIAFLVVFTVAAPFYLQSDLVLATAAFITRAGAWMLRGVGVQAEATGSVLATMRGSFAVTPECVATPLIPLYLAAVVAWPASWPRRIAALGAAAPIFVGLGIARVLVVALPASLVASPNVLVHAFYQLLLAAALVGLAACWRHGRGPAAWRRAVLGAALGVGIAWLIAPLSARALAWTFSGDARLADPQGAIGLLPVFQVGLFAALAAVVFTPLAWRPLLAGLALLGLSQIAVLTALHVAVRHWSMTPQVRDVRAWALAVPLLIVVALVIRERPRR